MNKTKILSVILFTAVVFSILAASIVFGVPNVVHPGDVNRDGTVDVKDLFVLRSYLAGDVGAIPMSTTTGTTVPTEPPITADDFELTISVENSALPQGENFRVNVELRNNSGREVEIARYFMFYPHIYGEDWIFDRIPPPWPTFEVLESGSVVSQVICLNRYYKLSQGNYQLNVKSVFYLDWEQPLDPKNEPIPWQAPENARVISIVSNTVTLIVH